MTPTETSLRSRSTSSIDSGAFRVEKEHNYEVLSRETEPLPRHLLGRLVRRARRDDLRGDEPAQKQRRPEATEKERRHRRKDQERCGNSGQDQPDRTDRSERTPRN